MRAADAPMYAFTPLLHQHSLIYQYAYRAPNGAACQTKALRKLMLRGDAHTCFPHMGTNPLLQHLCKLFMQRPARGSIERHLLLISNIERSAGCSMSYSAFPIRKDSVATRRARAAKSHPNACINIRRWNHMLTKRGRTALFVAIGHVPSLLDRNYRPEACMKCPSETQP